MRYRTHLRRLLAMFFVASVVGAGEQVIQRDRKFIPVVTLLDPDRTDPYEYRWVVINSKKHDFSIVVDRYVGRVYQCLGQPETQLENPVKGCELVYEGPTIGGKK